MHDQFGGVATEERWVGAKAPGGDATAEERGCPVVLGRGRWRVVGRRASQETDYRVLYLGRYLVQECHTDRPSKTCPSLFVKQNREAIRKLMVGDGVDSC